MVYGEDRFKDKVVVITGVLGKLGSTFAHAFLEQGASVIGIDVQPKASESQHDVISNPKFELHQADVVDSNAIRDVHDAIISKFGRVDILVNNAAIDNPPGHKSLSTGPFERVPLIEFSRVMETNFLGTVNCCQIFGGHMASAGVGSIINMGSIYGTLSPDQSLYDHLGDGHNPFFKPGAYGASKAAVINLTKYLAAYWARNMVRVNCLSPSGVYGDQERRFLEKYTSRIPIGRMSLVGELVEPLFFLADDGASYVTGHNLVVDGGWSSI